MWFRSLEELRILSFQKGVYSFSWPNSGSNMGQLRERQSIPEITKSLTIVWSKPYERHQLCRIEFPLYDPATNHFWISSFFLSKTVSEEVSMPTLKNLEINDNDVASLISMSDLNQNHLMAPRATYSRNYRNRNTQEQKTILFHGMSNFTSPHDPT